MHIGIEYTDHTLQHLQRLVPTTTTTQSKYVTRFVKTRHNSTFLNIQIFATINSIYLKLCSVVISMLCKYVLSYKARIQGRMEGGFLGFQETPFDSKTISKITYFNNYTIINSYSLLCLP